MENNSGIQAEIGNFKEIMSGIEFMEKYLGDPDIFNPDSTSFKNFLIHSFCFLYPDFHYLSFLNKEDFDHEIIKVSAILQILPKNMKEITKLFDNMSKDDIHQFWLKFFTLFKNRNEFSSDSIFIISWENKVNFFKNMANTLNYLNYEFPGVSKRKFKSVNVDEEISIWQKQKAQNKIFLDECASYTNINNNYSNNNEEQTNDIDIEKLNADLKQFLSVYGNQKLINQANTPEYVDFFNVFINHTKSILEFKENLNIIKSIGLDKLDFTMLSNDDNLSESLYFLKRCNNYVKTLRSKVKALS